MHRIRRASSETHYLSFKEAGRRDWTRTNDPHHVKVML